MSYITRNLPGLPKAAQRRGILEAPRNEAPNVIEIVTKLNTAFAEFKKQNDKALNSKADIVLSEQVDRINNRIGELQTELNTVLATRALAGSGSPGSETTLADSHEVFNRENRSPVSREQFVAYSSAFNQFLRLGNGAPAEVRNAMMVSSDPDGGYTVAPDLSGRIVKRVHEISPLRSLASVVSIGTDVLEGYNDLDEAGAGWVSERGARAETTSPSLGRWTIPTHELYAEPRVTQKLLDDSSWNIEVFLEEKVAHRFVRLESEAFLSGSGVDKPRGILTYPTDTTADASRAWGTIQFLATGANGAFGSTPAGSDILIDLVFAPKAAFRSNSSFLMNRGTLAAVRKLKDGNGDYIWQPNFEARSGGLLLGFPVTEDEFMPAHTSTGAFGIAFGDFAEAYTIVDRIGIRILRDPFTAKPFILFYTTKRVGGGMINSEAVKLLKFAS